MNKYGEILEDGSMKFVRFLPGGIERAWSWVTEADKRAQWLCGGGDITAAGQTIKFDFRHKDLTPHDETIPDQYKEMENGAVFDIDVVKCEPPRLLVVSWPAEGVVSEVEFRFSEENGKVRLELIQRDHGSPDQMIGALGGWHTHLDIMVDKLNGETPKPFWKTHTALVEDYSERFKSHLATLK